MWNSVLGALFGKHLIGVINADLHPLLGHEFAESKDYLLSQILLPFSFLLLHVLEKVNN